MRDDELDDPDLVALERHLGGLVLYHSTVEEAAAAILKQGFRDATGSYMLGGIELTGVWVSNPTRDATLRPSAALVSVCPHATSP
jgi:hypothetical protein